MSLRGSSVGLRSQHYAQVLDNLPKDVQWFEVISENFMFTRGRALDVLEKIRANYAVACHGVGLGIGNHHATPERYLKALKELVDRFQPAVVSDHLCWTTRHLHNSHDLLPVSYTARNLQLICDKVSAVQDFIGRRILLENPSAYVGAVVVDFSEAQFLKEICLKTGCGVLLDLNNLFVNFSNLRSSIAEYFEYFSASDIGQFHIAGHSNNGTVRIDTHDHPVCDEVIAIYRQAQERWSNIPLLLEWDDHIPTWDELLSELRRVETSVVEPFESWCRGKTYDIDKANKQTYPFEPTFFSMMTQRQNISAEDERLEILSQDLPVPATIGMNVYNNAYFLRQRDILKESFPSLLAMLKDAKFEEFALDYLERYPSQEFNISMIGTHVCDYLASFNPKKDDEYLTVLHELARYDWLQWTMHFEDWDGDHATLETLATMQPEDWEVSHISFRRPFQLAQFNINIPEVLDLVAKGENIFTSKTWNTATSMLLVKIGHNIHTKVLTDPQTRFVAGCLHQESLGTLMADKNEDEMQQAMSFVMECLQQETIHRIASH